MCPSCWCAWRLSRCWRILAYRRVQAINARIAELDEERARNPLDPFSALMELYRLQEEHKRGKRE